MDWLSLLLILEEFSIPTPALALPRSETDIFGDCGSHLLCCWRGPVNKTKAIKRVIFEQQFALKVFHYPAPTFQKKEQRS